MSDSDNRQPLPRQVAQRAGKSLREGVEHGASSLQGRSYGQFWLGAWLRAGRGLTRRTHHCPRA